MAATPGCSIFTMNAALDDPLRHIFTEAVIEKLRRKLYPTPELVHRLRVIEWRDPRPLAYPHAWNLASRSAWRTLLERAAASEALDRSLVAQLKCGSHSEEHAALLMQLVERCGRSLRAQRTAWDTYLHAAISVGLLAGKLGADLTGRLRDPRAYNFRGAMAECLTSWFLAGKLRMPLAPGTAGRGRSRLEFMLGTSPETMRVEVKAPHTNIPLDADVWRDDDSNILRSALDEAHDQFANGVANLLVVVPVAKIPIHEHPDQLIRAFIGQEQIAIPINRRTGTGVGPARLEFTHDGALTSRRRTPREPHTTSRPFYTRVSAVLCIEEVTELDTTPPWTDHRALLLLNPNAEIAMPSVIVDSLASHSRVISYNDAV